MNGADQLPQQAVVRHGVEDARLAEQHDQHDGAESGEGAGGDDVAAPHFASLTNGERNGRADVDLALMCTTPVSRPETRM